MTPYQSRSVRLQVEALETRTVPSASPAAVAGAITHSYEANYRQIVDDYANLLHRSAAPAEVNGWVQRLAAGMSVEQAEAAFAGSLEYRNDHGGGGAPWISSLYQDLLGRAPAQAEVNGWLSALNAGASPDAVAIAFATGTEHLSQRVISDYQLFLGRTPAQTEVDGWVGFLHSGGTDQDMTAAFAASFENITVRHHDDIALWLTDLYQNVLGRTAAESEIDGWLAVMGVRRNPPSTPTPPQEQDLTSASSDSFGVVDTFVNNPITIVTDPGTITTDPGTVATDPGTVDNSNSYTDPAPVDNCNCNTDPGASDSTPAPDPGIVDYTIV
jgi:hypothetical protein